MNFTFEDTPLLAAERFIFKVLLLIRNEMLIYFNFIRVGILESEGPYGRAERVHTSLEIRTKKRSLLKSD